MTIRGCGHIIICIHLRIQIRPEQNKRVINAMTSVIPCSLNYVVLPDSRVCEQGSKTKWVEWNRGS